MAYALSRSIAARYALSVTLDAGYVRAGRGTGKERAWSSSSICFDDNGTHIPSSSRSTVHSDCRDNRLLYQSEERTVGTPECSQTILKERRTGIGVSANGERGIPKVKSLEQTNTNTSVHSDVGLDQSIRYIQQRRNTDSPKQVKDILSLCRQILLKLRPKRHEWSMTDRQTRRRAVKIYQVYIQLIDTLTEDYMALWKHIVSLAEWREVMDPELFEGAIALVACHYRLEHHPRDIRNLAQSLNPTSTTTHSTISPDSTSSPPTSYTLRIDKLMTPMEACRLFKRQLSTSVIIPIDSISENSGNKLDMWSRLSISSILQTMENCAIPLTTSILVSLIRIEGGSLIPTGPYAITKRAMMGINHDKLGRAAVDLWKGRESVLTSSRMLDSSIEEEFEYNEQIIKTIDEADVLSLKCHSFEVERKLTEMLPFWRDQRDRMVVRAHETVLPLCFQWANLVNGLDPKRREPVRTWNRRQSMAILFLIRNSLLPPRLRPPRPIFKRHIPLELEGGVPRLDDPFDLLGMLLGISNVDWTEARPKTIKTINSAVIRMRNAFYHHDNFGDLSRLIKFFIPALSHPHDSTETSRYNQEPKLVIPVLEGTVYSSWITTAKTQTQFRDLLILLARLPQPSSVPTINHSTRRLLRHQARLTRLLPLESHDHFRLLPMEAKESSLSNGYDGLLDWLFTHWGVLDTPRREKNVENEDEEGIGDTSKQRRWVSPVQRDTTVVRTRRYREATSEDEFFPHIAQRY